MAANQSVKKIPEAGSGYLSKAAEFISKSAAPKQLLIGSVAGWTAGFVTVRLSKTLIRTVGGGILLFQIGQTTKLVKMNWNNVKDKVNEASKKLDAKYKYIEKSPQWKSNVTLFARSNTFFAAGFAGGFLIGLTS